MVRSLTVRERILLHLLDDSRFADEAQAPVGVTKAGIAEVAGIRVRRVAEHVKPLQAEGLIEARTTHVRGERGRPKVYFLTVRGRLEAASLRKSLLKKTVTFTRLAGQARRLPLSTTYQEEGSGASLLSLLGELTSVGYVARRQRPDTSGLIEDLQEAPLEDRFYGREEQLERVREALHRAPMVVVVGIAGVGKTAFAAKVCDSFKGKRSVFWCRVRPWNVATDLGLRLGTFLDSLGRPDLFNHLTGIRPRGFSRLEEILEVDLPAIESLLVFDDLHKASPEAQTFFSILLDALKEQGGSSALLLSRTLPDFYSRRQVALEGSVEEVPLGGLDREACDALLGDAGIGDTSREVLWRATGGNPLFLKMLAKGWGKGKTEDWWTLETYIAEEIEPTLARDECDCLQVASLYEIPVPAQGLLFEEGGGGGTLIGLEKKGLLDRLAGDRFVLHDVLRNYFQRGLALDRRRNLVERVVPWLLNTAEKEAAKGNPQDAVAQVENALMVEVDPARRVTSRERLGELRRLEGDFPGAIGTFRKALDATEDRKVKARLHGRIAAIMQTLWRLKEAEEEIEKGLAFLPSKPSLEAGWLLLRKADVAYYRRELDDSLEEVERVRGWTHDLPVDRNLLAELSNLRGTIHLNHRSRPDAALALGDFRTALDAWEATGNQRGISRAHDRIGSALQRLGRSDEALGHLDLAASVADEAGDLPQSVSARFSKAWLLARMGRLEEGEELFLKTFDLAGELHDSHRLIWHYLHLGILYWLEGRVQDAKESLEYFLETGGDFLDAESRVAYLTALVRLSVASDDPETAQTHLQSARELASRIRSDYATFRIEWARGAFLAGQGEREEADGCFRRALDLSSAGDRSDIIEERIIPIGVRGWFLLEYGQFLSSVGSLERSKKVLLEAREDLGQDGIRPLEEAAAESLRKIGSP